MPAAELENNNNNLSKSSHTILHFNDCYNIEPRDVEPVGGAARFKSAIKSFSNCDPIILFSGDVIAPSIISTFTKGEQMIPVLNDCDVHCALYGNHEFDFGVENLIDFVDKTNFPWLMSNVIDNETNRPLGDGKITHILENKGKKFGLIGLIEEEWLASLATLALDDVTYLDFVSEGKKLAKFLKEKEGVDYVIALTHMRTPNDCRLAENVDEIDLILGGHDHVYEIKKVNGKFIIKSGTDFRQFSKIDLTFDDENVNIAIKEININSCDFAEDVELKEKLEKFSEVVEMKMDTVLGHFGCELDGRFSSIRTKETNLGNFICDIMLSSTHSDLAILNSGTLRSDTLHPKGPFTLRDLVTILPYMDPLIVLNASGDTVWRALENGVSQWPKMEGRFPQVSGVKFTFDPTKPPGQRVDPTYVTVGDEYLDLNQNYRLVTKLYLYQGKDGYDMLKDCQVLQSDEECPEMITSIQNHFESIKILTGKRQSQTNHRQSLVCVSRRTSVVKMHEINSFTDNDTSHSTKTESCHRFPLKKGISLDASSKKNILARCSSLESIEYEQCKLEPKLESRIRILTSQILVELELEKKEFMSKKIIDDAIPEEDDDAIPEGDDDAIPEGDDATQEEDNVAIQEEDEYEN